MDAILGVVLNKWKARRIGDNYHRHYRARKTCRGFEPVRAGLTHTPRAAPVRGGVSRPQSPLERVMAIPSPVRVCPRPRGGPARLVECIWRLFFALAGSPSG